VSNYSPADLSPIAIDLGTWSASGQPDRSVSVVIDPRLFAWMVRQAARRASLSYQVKLGRPPLECTLT
jgi:hypothetical protein